MEIINTIKNNNVFTLTPAIEIHWDTINTKRHFHITIMWLGWYIDTFNNKWLDEE